MKWLAVMWLLGPIVAAATPTCQVPTDEKWDHYLSDELNVALRLPEGEIRPRVFLPLEVHVCAADGAYPTTEPTLSAAMPMHGHGTNYDPVLRNIAPGRYRVEGLSFHMHGQWTLAVGGEFDGEYRETVFEIDVPQ